MTGLPLEGITVVSIEQAVAAPFGTRQLADLGARVIKIERGTGDFARGYDSTVLGDSSFFVWLNRGKESVVLDLKSAEDAAVLHELVLQADVLVQNLAPGALERAGFGYDLLAADNPGLIYVDVSGYGRGGSLTTKKAYDLLIQCEAGLLSVTGTPDQPSKVGISIADIATGMYVYAGVLTALIQRGKTGRGDRLEVTMLEALGEWMQQPFLYAAYSGTQPARSGAAHPTIAPYGPFGTADGTVFLGVQNDAEWQRLCATVLGDSGLAADQRFHRNDQRVKHRNELDALVGAALARKTSDDVVTLLDECGIANAKLRDMAGFGDHPQLAERARWIDVETPHGTARGLLPPVTAAGYRAAEGPVPALGADTERVKLEATALRAERRAS
jgi:itaconate CoA-transferase